MLVVKINDQTVIEVLDKLVARAGNVRPALLEIGEDLVESTKGRFSTATAPDGTPWAANSQVTIDRYLGVFKSSFKKDGSLSKAGQARATNKKPLTGETRTLQGTINYQLRGSTGVSIGSPKIQAAMMQFGGTTAQFPHLWGDIPARRFLGLSASDRLNVLEILNDYLVG